MSIDNLILPETTITKFSSKLTSPYKLSRTLRIRKEIVTLWNNWYEIDGSWYYFKAFNNYPDPTSNFINELIGEYLSLYLDIPSVHYKIGKADDKYGLLSLYFRDKKNRYIDPRNIGLYANYNDLSNLENIISCCKNENNFKEVVNELSKMIAIDLYMGQTDRTSNNFVFQKNKDGLHLAPLYDFENSFLTPRSTYEPISYNAACLFTIKLKHKEEIKKHPELEEYLNRLLYLDIEKVLSDIQESLKIDIPKERVNAYKNYVEKRKKLLL